MSHVFKIEPRIKLYFSWIFIQTRTHISPFKKKKTKDRRTNTVLVSKLNLNTLHATKDSGERLTRAVAL